MQASTFVPPLRASPITPPPPCLTHRASTAVPHLSYLSCRSGYQYKLLAVPSSTKSSIGSGLNIVNCHWDQTKDALIRAVWNKQSAKGYSDMVSDMKSEGKIPSFLDQAYWEHWTAYLNTPSVKRMLEQYSKNTISSAIDASGPSTYTGGSATHYEHEKLLEQLCVDENCISILLRRMNENELYLQLLTGKNKRWIYGLGSQASEYLKGMFEWK